jgi:hypothetical protein
VNEGAPPGVVVLGGGAAGLSAAYELTRPELGDDRLPVSVYTPGWRLGGKGASGRGAFGRIEEHGLHIWFGFYLNAFGLLGDAYERLRAAGAASKFETIADAFSPCNQLGLVEPLAAAPGGGPASWETRCFPLAARERFQPREGFGSVPLLFAGIVERTAPLQAGAFAARADLESLAAKPPAEITEAELLEAAESFRRWGEELGPGAPRHAAAVAMRVLALCAVFALPAWLRGKAPDGDLARRGPFDELNEIDLREALSGRPNPGREPSAAAGRIFERLRKIDRLRCDREAIDSAVVRVLYDLAFAYRGGDRAKPDVAAGVAVENIINIGQRHGGTVMWKMNAGMGDVVFAPLYRALAEPPAAHSLPVEFHFFSAVERIVLGPDDAVEEIAIRRQLRVAAGPAAYRPLTPGKLPTWPSQPYAAQIEAADREAIAAVERRWRVAGRLGEGQSIFPAFEREPNPLGRDDAESLETLRRGRDFSEVVLAMPPAAIGALARESERDLLNACPDLDATLKRAHPVATQALQAWFDIPRVAGGAQRLGWPPDCGNAAGGSPVLGGYCKRFADAAPFDPPPGAAEMFDTYCDLTHLLGEESWGEDPPRHLAYFCRVAPLRADEGHEAADRRAWKEARDFLAEHHALAPAARPFWDRDYAPEHLTDRRPSPARGWDRVAAQYARCNSGPSERYSTSHAGTVNARLHPGDLRAGRGPLGARVPNLTLAGDWTYTAVNAGSVEAAVMSGIEAAATLLGPASGPAVRLPWWRRKPAGGRR